MQVSHSLPDGKKLSLLMAVSTKSRHCFCLVEGSVAAIVYYDFVLKLANCAKDRIVLLQDNARIHYGPICRLAYHQAGILTLSPPPYSPESNPIEMIFNYLKDRKSVV